MRVMSVRGFLIGVIVDASEIVVSRASASLSSKATAHHDSVVVADCATTLSTAAPPTSSLHEPTWVLNSDTRLPSFAGYAIRCFFTISYWIMESGVVALSMGIFIKGIQLFASMFPRRAGRGVNFALEVLEDNRNLLKEIAAESRLAKRMSSANKKREQRLLKQGSTGSVTSVFDKYHNESINGGVPLAMENTFALMQPAPDGEGDGDSLLRSVVWQSDLENTILSEANFGTSCRDPRTVDLVALFVGSRDAHIIRYDDEDNLFPLVGLADLGMAVRWMWRDAVKEFDAGKRELHTIQLK
ncbi:hypothetical protein MN608_06523 [Microdochium nivale]|nr:hypothetical protein MN608_06523 [Microdochium nivale]